jgi:hypothetical protein
LEDIQASAKYDFPAVVQVDGTVVDRVVGFQDIIGFVCGEVSPWLWVLSRI